MTKIDYHVHNHFSPDSRESTRKIAQQATAMHFGEICITNHAEKHDSQTGRSLFDVMEAAARFTEIRTEIAAVQTEFPDLRIGFGAEVEFAENRLDALSSWIESMGFDFVLGSVHVVDGIVISSHKYADQLFSKRNEQTAYEAYFHELMSLVKWGQTDVIAHFDICKKYGSKFYGAFRPEKYKKLIIPILEVMAKKGIGLELNTKCVKDKCKEIFPHPDILRWALEVGIKNFTVGSDAHKAAELGQNFTQAFVIAARCGLKTVSAYHQRKPVFYPIETDKA